MSEATTSGRPSPSRSRNRTLATAGVGSAPAGRSAWRVKRSGLCAASGQGMGSGSARGARVS